MSSEKYGLGLWIFGKLLDRFVSQGYKTGVPFQERIRLVSRIELLRGIELTYPSDFNSRSPEEILKILREHNLEISGIDIDLFSEPRWQRGSITSKDDKLRMEAIKRVKDAIDIARKMGVKNVIIWPGQDGHDYLFSDHRERWRRLIDAMKEVSSYCIDETIYLEYKPKEPRTHSILSNVGKTLHLIERVGSSKLGVLIDVGHALMADENLAESVFLIHDSGLPLFLHLNDAYGYWDDDMIMGSINLWKFVEFFHALETIKYDGWYDLDIFPYREDPVKASEQCLKFIHYLRTKVREYHDDISDAISAENVHKALEIVWKTFLRDFR